MNTQSIGDFDLVANDFDDALYYSVVNEMACTSDSICNKNMSNAGQERLAGQLGNRR